MLDLQNRAHESLDEFRKGSRSSPGRLGSMDPHVPTSENDELAILGGKTRLVKKEPGSPPMFDRSPNSQHPVVPLPLSPTAAQADPNLVEYLNSFQQQQQPASASSSNSYSDGAEMSPVSMYGLTSLPGTNGFHSEAVNYPIASAPHSHSTMPSVDPSFQQQPHHHHHPNSSMNGSSGVSSFPQYFHVYDYGASTSTNSYAPMLDSSPVPQRRSSSGSPDQNMMHTAWQEFVTSSGFVPGN